jgi:hypothetical protein
MNNTDDLNREFFSSKKARMAKKAQRRIETNDDMVDFKDNLRYSSRGKAVAIYDDAVINDDLLESPIEGEELYDHAPVAEYEGDVIEMVLDYRITTITNEGRLRLFKNSLIIKRCRG